MSYITKVYTEIGGDKQVVASGGAIEVQSGGDINVKSGGEINLEAGGLIAGLGDTGVITVSNAELLALNATPKTLVAAQGANKVVIPVLIVAKCVFLTAAFDGVAAGEDLAARYTDGSGAIAMTIEATGFVDQGTDQTRYQAMGATLITPVANSPLVLHMTSGEIATGGGHLLVRVLYRVVDVSFT